MLVNIFFMVAAAFCFMGMAGERRDMKAKEGYTYGFLACMIGLIVINM